jgi:hypothetical protein
MDRPPNIRLDLLPPGDWPHHFVEEVGVAQVMFDELTNRAPEDPAEIVVGAYIVAFREGARSLFFVQDAMNQRDPGKDAIEKLAVSCVMSGADELVLVSETWTVKAEGHTVESIYKWRDAHGGTLKDHPAATESLMVTHHTFMGDIVAGARINREDGRPPFLTDWKAQRQSVQRGQGRFQNFYQKAAALRGEDN